MTFAIFRGVFVVLFEYQIQSAAPTVSWEAAEDILREWFLDAHRDSYHHHMVPVGGDDIDAGDGDSGSASSGGRHGGGGRSSGGVAAGDGIIHSMDQSPSGRLRGVDHAEQLWATSDEYVIGWFERQAHAIARHIGVLRYKYVVSPLCLLFAVVSTCAAAFLCLPCVCT